MSGPGKGRYTTYVPVSSARNSLLWRLFNRKAPGDAGVIYNGQDPFDNNKAAVAAVATATANVNAAGVGGLSPSNGNQAGDISMFPTGVNLKYTGTTEVPVPNLEDVKWTKPGDPANAYVPDISSPGPGRTQGIEKDVNPNVEYTDIKPNYVPGGNNLDTVSPDTSSPTVAGVIGKTLVPGKSSV
jgi:hypothetical protein